MSAWRTRAPQDLEAGGTPISPEDTPNSLGIVTGEVLYANVCCEHAD